MKEVKDINSKVSKCESNYQYDDMKYLLEILELEIKMCKLNLDILEIQKPFWFQKEKMKKYRENHQEIENRIKKLKNQLNKELRDMSDLFDK